MAGGLSTVDFTIGNEQKATQVTIENLNAGGQGTFLRAAEKNAAEKK
jgi:hypothetical protein